MAEIDHAGPSMSSSLNRQADSNLRTSSEHRIDTSLPSNDQDQQQQQQQHQHHHHHHHHHHHKSRKPSSGGFLIEPRRRSVYNGSPFISVDEHADKKPSKHKRVSRDFSGSSDVSRKHRYNESVNQRSVSGQSQLQPSLSGGTAKGKDRPMSLRLEDERLQELLAKATESDTAWIVGMANSIGRSKSSATENNKTSSRGDIPDFSQGSPMGSPRLSNSIPDLKPQKRRASIKPVEELSDLRDNYSLSSRKVSPPPEWAFNHKPRRPETYENDEVDPIPPNRTQELKDGRSSMPDSRFSSQRNSVDVSNSESRYSSKKNSLEIRKESLSRNASSSPEPKFRNQAPKNSFGSGVLEPVADIADASDEDAPKPRRLRVRRTHSHSTDLETDSLNKKPSTATRGVNKLRNGATKVRTGVSGIIRGHKGHEDNHEHEHDMMSTESSVDEDELADLQNISVKEKKKWDGSVNSDTDDFDDRNGKKQKRRFAYRLQPFKNSVKNGSINTSTPPSPSRGTASSFEEDRRSAEYRDRTLDDDHVARQANAQKEKSEKSKVARLGLPGLQTGNDTSRGRSPARHVVIESMEQKSKRLKQEEKDRIAALNKKDFPEDQSSDHYKSEDPSPVKTHDFALDHQLFPQTAAKPDHRKDLLRVRTAMLSTGILARAISKPKANPYSRLEACSVVVNRANSVTSHLSKSITENAQSMTSVMKSFQAPTVSSIRRQIDDIQHRITDSFVPAVQSASDQADELNAMVASTYTLEIKKLADQGEIMIQKKGKGKRQFSQWGYLALEWVLLAIMWMVWFVWMVIRVFKVTIGAVIKGIRWLLWI